MRHRKKSLCVLATKFLILVNYISLIVGNPRGILDQQFMPHPIHWLNIIIKLIKWKYVFLNKTLITASGQNQQV
jgi:hypothetical protein